MVVVVVVVAAVSCFVSCFLFLLLVVMVVVVTATAIIQPCDALSVVVRRSKNQTRTCGCLTIPRFTMNVHLKHLIMLSAFYLEDHPS